MRENNKETAYFNLVYQTEQTAPQVGKVDRLAGSFARAILQAQQESLTHEELVAALTIGHYLGSRGENISPDYLFLFAQLDYWEAVYLEAEQYWLGRYRGDQQ